MEKIHRIPLISSGKRTVNKRERFILTVPRAYTSLRCIEGRDSRHASECTITMTHKVFTRGAADGL